MVTAEYVVQMKLIYDSARESHMRLERVEGDLDSSVSLSIWICLSIVSNGDISFDLSLYIGIDVVPAALAKEVVAFTMRSEVNQGRQGSNTVHTRKFIVVHGVYVSIELMLHLVDRRIVLRLGARPLVAFASDGEAIPQRLRLFDALTEMRREGSPLEEIVLAAPWAFNVARAGGRHCRQKMN